MSGTSRLFFFNIFAALSNHDTFFAFQGTLEAKVYPSHFHMSLPPLSTVQVFGVSGQPSSVTVNGSPVHNFNYTVSTKVNISCDGPSGLGTSDGSAQVGFFFPDTLGVNSEKQFFVGQWLFGIRRRVGVSIEARSYRLVRL